MSTEVFNALVKLRKALEKIDSLAEPSGTKWYDSWGDPIGVDISNGGDQHYHGVKMGLYQAGEIARAALKEAKE